MKTPLTSILHQFKMWCFVSEPNGIIHELVLPRESSGNDCLDKVCSRLHLVEKDYFGLLYKNPSTGTDTWLNLRNRLSDQLVGKAPHRLQLSVKYYVKAQELQQQVTRDLFYSSIHQHLTDGRFNLTNIDSNTLAQLLALIAQAEFGDFDSDLVPDYASFLPSLNKWSPALQKLVETEHLNLSLVAVPEAKVKFIHLASDLAEYGTECFHVTSCSSSAELKLIIRHDGLRIYESELSEQNDTECCSSDQPMEICLNDGRKEAKIGDFIKFIPYDEISTVSYRGKKFTIVHGDSTEPFRLSFRLPKNHCAINLFRTFTEYHSFYQCNVVKSSVLEKCTRNTIGRLASFFKPRCRTGRLYLFDILRTRRQAYNHAWTELNAPEKKRQSLFYHSERHFSRKNIYTGLNSDPTVTVQSIASVKSRRKVVSGDFDFFQYCDESGNATKTPRAKSLFTDAFDELKESSGSANHMSVDELRETVSNLLDARTCQVCMDSDVSTAFCPCGHVVCCLECSEQCKECPLCRTQITYVQRVFFSSS